MSVQELDNMLQQVKVEWEKLERGNKSAGTRARKLLSSIAKTCAEMCKEVQEIKAGMGGSDEA